VANTWTTPRTWVASAILTAAQLNVDVRDNGDFLATSRPNCRVFNSGAITLTNNTTTALTFDSERYDRGSGLHSTVTNTGRLTVPSGCAGVYWFGANVEIAANATGVRELALRINGTTNIAFVTLTTVTAADTAMININAPYAMSVGDYCEVTAFQNSGGSLSATAAGARSPEFWGSWMST
jgi:hypothetical protein